MYDILGYYMYKVGRQKVPRYWSNAANYIRVIVLWYSENVQRRSHDAPASYSFLTDTTDFLVGDRTVDALIEHSLLLNLTQQNNHWRHTTTHIVEKSYLSINVNYMYMYVNTEHSSRDVWASHDDARHVMFKLRHTTTHARHVTFELRHTTTLVTWRHLQVLGVE